MTAETAGADRVDKTTAPQESGNGQSANPAAAAEFQPDANGKRDNQQQAPAGREGAALSRTEQERTDTWPPPQADQDRIRTLYEEDFGPKNKAGDSNVGRDQGVNVIGDKPLTSHDDISDLPPTGQELLESEDENATRAEKFRNLFRRELGDVDDGVNNAATTVQDVLDRPPPTGHPGVVTDTQPHWAPEFAANATPDIASFAELGLVLGVLGDRTVQYFRHKVTEMRGRD